MVQKRCYEEGKKRKKMGRVKLPLKKRGGEKIREKKMV